MLDQSKIVALRLSTHEELKMLLGRCTMFTISKAVTQSLRPCVPVCARGSLRTRLTQVYMVVPLPPRAKRKQQGLFIEHMQGPLSPVFPSVIP